FLHKIVDGPADKSYGIHVARLAGLPTAVIERAKEVLSNLENDSLDGQNRPRIARDHGRKRKKKNTKSTSRQPSLFDLLEMDDW
ncbi:MAG: hypothetical protein D6820_09640, partial [Lentisphaerae bacterium]